MNRLLTATAKTLALGLVLAAPALSAQAQGTLSAHTWVSGTGSNANPCSRSAPCATFQYALDQTAAGGVVSAVNAGDYGPVAINKAITIDGTGTQASVVVSSLSAISINAGTSDAIILRHLTLTSTSNQSTDSGIRIDTGGSLLVDDCQVVNFANGITLFPTNNGAALIKNTVITGCLTGIGVGGLSVNGSSNAPSVSLRDVTIHGTNFGLTVDNGATDIKDSQVTQNKFLGIVAGGNGTTLSASGCTISGNGTGVDVERGGLIRLNNNDIFNNTVGIDTSTNGGGIVSTAGNNRKAGNTTSGAPTPGRIITVQ